jgi:hypothetical protein
LESERCSRRRDEILAVVDETDAAELAGGSLHRVALTEICFLAEHFSDEFGTGHPGRVDIDQPLQDRRLHR